MTENEITYKIIGAVFNVYNGLGPGLLESIYEKVLMYELGKQGLAVQSQVPIPVTYDGLSFGADLRADLLVEGRVIVELKSVSELRDVHYKQLLTYLRLTGNKVGLLVNFDTDNIKASIHRIVNGL
ncbi:MAG: GxxExxY protein [Prevotella sp.]|nr:GxxExxY protein [Prevotella sp.]